jgi:hypothetical protein
MDGDDFINKLAKQKASKDKGALGNGTAHPHVFWRCASLFVGPTPFFSFLEMCKRVRSIDPPPPPPPQEQQVARKQASKQASPVAAIAAGAAGGCRGAAAIQSQTEI